MTVAKKKVVRNKNASLVKSFAAKRPKLRATWKRRRLSNGNAALSFPVGRMSLKMKAHFLKAAATRGFTGSDEDKIRKILMDFTCP